MVIKRKATRVAARRQKKRQRTMNISVPRRVPRPIRVAIPTIAVKRTCYLGTVTPNSSSTPAFWRYISTSLDSGFTNESNFSMGGLTNLAEYTPLFDQYRLNAIKYVLRPRQGMNVADQNNATAISHERGYHSVLIDKAGTITPTGTFTSTTYNTFLENGNVRTYDATKPVTIYIKPLVQEQYGSGAFRYVKPRWTDLGTAGNAMPHRGFHLFTHTNSMNTASLGRYAYDVFVTYFIQFKGQR